MPTARHPACCPHLQRGPVTCFPTGAKAPLDLLLGPMSSTLWGLLMLHILASLWSTEPRSGVFDSVGHGGAWALAGISIAAGPMDSKFTHVL